MRCLPWILIGMGVFAMAVMAFVAYSDWTHTSGTADPWNERAQRGDYWGGHLAALGSLSGTFFLLATLLYQANELKLQREELSASREVASQQAKALREQQEELARQNKILEDQQRDTREQLRLLRVQNIAIRKRESYDFIREHVPQLGNVSIARLIYRRIVDAAVNDVEHGLDLLEYLRAQASPPQMASAASLLGSIASRYGARLVNAGQGLLAGTWLQFATRILTDQEYDWRAENEREMRAALSETDTAE